MTGKRVLVVGKISPAVEDLRFKELKYMDGEKPEWFMTLTHDKKAEK